MEFSKATDSVQGEGYVYKAIEVQVEIDTQYIEHHLKAAIGEWYAWLGDKTVHVDEWLSVPAWHMMRTLFIIVDEVWLCSQEMDGVPDITKLRDELRKVDNV